MSTVNLPKFPAHVVVADPSMVAKVCDFASVFEKVGEITDDASCLDARTLLTHAAKLLKTIDDRRKDVKKPFTDVGKQIDAVAGPLLTSLERIVQELKRRLLAYDQRVEQERIAREAELVRDAGDGRPTAPLDLTGPSAAPVAKRRTPKVEITDAKLIPREYLMPNLDAIAQAMLVEGKTVPGCAVVITETIISR